MRINLPDFTLILQGFVVVFVVVCQNPVAVQFARKWYWVSLMGRRLFAATWQSRRRGIAVTTQTVTRDSEQIRCDAYCNRNRWSGQ